MIGCGYLANMDALKNALLQQGNFDTRMLMYRLDPKLKVGENPVVKKFVSNRWVNTLMNQLHQASWRISHIADQLAFALFKKKEVTYETESGSETYKLLKFSKAVGTQEYRVGGEMISMEYAGEYVFKVTFWGESHNDEDPERENS